MRTWLVAGGVVAGLVAFFAIGLVFVADREGMPVPVDFRGTPCQQYGRDLRSCDAGDVRHWYVRVGELWHQPSRCRPASPTRLRCTEPFGLELDVGGEFPRLRRLDDG